MRNTVNMSPRQSAQFPSRRVVATISLFLLAFGVVALVRTVQELDEAGTVPSDWKLPSSRVARHSNMGHHGVTRRKISASHHSITSNDKAGNPQQIDRNFEGNPATQLSPLQFSCNEIRNIRITSELGRGYTKTVQKGLYGGQEVAVKSVQPRSRDIIACAERREMPEDECFNVSEQKLVKEALLLRQLKHPNIVKVGGGLFSFVYRHCILQYPAP